MISRNDLMLQRLHNLKKKNKHSIVSESDNVLDPRSLYKRKEYSRNQPKNTAPLLLNTSSVIKGTNQLRRSMVL